MGQHKKRCKTVGKNTRHECGKLNEPNLPRDKDLFGEVAKIRLKR